MAAEWFLILTAAGVAGGLHVWWRARHREAEERHSAELEKLRNAHATAQARMQRRQEAFLNSMTEGLVLLDEGGRIQMANQPFLRLFGVSGDVISKTLLEAIRMHELADLVPLLTAGTPVIGRNLRIMHSPERWVEVNGGAIIGTDGLRLGAVLVFHDLTRLKQLETARKEFVANVSHEIRTPLSLIQGYVETLLDGAKDDPRLSVKFLQTIERNAGRLRLLIEDLLTISELESGRVNLSLQPVQLNGLYAKVVEDFRTRAEDREVSLRHQCPDITVKADIGRVEQVLGNLVDNAIKYGRTGGTVVLRARQFPDGFAELSVQDDGPGIPPDSLERIFERFYRVDKARSREQGGTGLGLSIVKHIVQSHGGKVWAESQLKHGSTFYFTLPLASPPEGTAAP